MLDPARRQPTNSVQLSNGIGSSIHGYGRWEASGTSGFWVSKQVDDESGICSPPLWKKSPARSPQRHENHYQIQNLSPSSRTEAIARGHRELMEMVRNMPESTYELTLKDLVEKTTVEVGEENNEKEERSLIEKNAYRREGSGSSSGRKIDQVAMAKRSGNVQSGGFYLKMVFPTSLGSTKKKKKKKNDSSRNDGSKASIRPSMSEGSLNGGVDKEYWWKKSPSASGDSESGATSNYSGSTKSSGSSSSGSSRNGTSSRRERSRGSCWFLVGRKPKRLTQE